MSASGVAGALLLDKPAGCSSHDMVEVVRGLDAFKGLKVGHAGTLDPFATGLLVVLVGAATRFQDRLMQLEKCYSAGVQFGARSDTGDPEGTVESSGMSTTREKVEVALAGFRGVTEQRVPMTSAVKVGGERLYKKARRGETVETPLRLVEIKQLELNDFDQGRQIAIFTVTCSKGTYVRQLVTDLGETVGGGAYCLELRRTRQGPYSLDAATTPDLLATEKDPTASPAWLPLILRLGEQEL